MKKNNKKVAWITGGGTGIGKELAKVLVKNKWNVVISGRRIDKLNQVKNFGKNNITSLKLDISSSTQCQKIVKKIFRKFVTNEFIKQKEITPDIPFTTFLYKGIYYDLNPLELQNLTTENYKIWKN